MIRVSAPPDSSYRTLSTTAGRATGAAAAGTKYFALPGSADVSAPAPQTTNAAVFPILVQITAADYSASAKLRLSAICITQNKPEVTITVGLYPVTAGATQALGSVVTGSSAAFESPAANSDTYKNSGDFAPPVDGVYAVGYTVSGTPAVAFAFTARLEARNG